MREQRFAAIKDALGKASALAAYDPPQARILVLVALATIGIVGVWGLYAELFIPNLIVELVAVSLSTAGLLLVANLTGKLVRSHDRWQVESALTFRQMLSEGGKLAGGFQAGSPFYAQQLRLRLKEEIQHARDYGTSVSLVAMRIELLGQSPSHAVFTQANYEFAELAIRHGDTLLAPTALGMFEYAFFLRTADRKAAQSITQFLARDLKRYQCSFGIACFPEDGAEPELLLHRAMTSSGMLREAA
jgi:hypothetical protein